jgi:hypothetical protein
MATVMRGKVVDTHDGPIAGATVALTTAEEAPVGGGTTDEDGAYDFALAPHRRESLVLSVEAEGFQPWSGWVGWERLDGVTVALDRTVDAAYLTALREVSDPEARRMRIDEILALDDANFSLYAVFPFLGELREDLRAATRRPTRIRTSGRLLAERALELLAFWDDPADRDLVTPWRAERGWFRDPPEEVTAATTTELCDAWAKAHFARESFRAPVYWCSEAAVDPPATRALMLFDVTSALYHYTLHLVLVRASAGEPWRLRAVVEGVTDHPPY